ncbi:hypothetical protein E2C01_006134 [Portunus trituberculatus]|uniref:Uncharacterized protein n=1 Tax=Portunus trituberculatus TaxID=210409 RepID=A0A5B7CX27_PORTR|nr:hypothetical protein [Portunus trituberculatus]
MGSSVCLRRAARGDFETEPRITCGSTLKARPGFGDSADYWKGGKHTLTHCNAMEGAGWRGIVASEEEEEKEEKEK